MKPARPLPRLRHDNWPEAWGFLEGSIPLTISNRCECDLGVGLRIGTLGRDFVVPSQRSMTVRVPAGRYDIYYRLHNQPQALYRGESFHLRFASTMFISPIGLGNGKAIERIR
jgi:hypothetical protein